MDQKEANNIFCLIRDRWPVEACVSMALLFSDICATIRLVVEDGDGNELISRGSNRDSSGEISAFYPFTHPEDTGENIGGIRCAVDSRHCLDEIAPLMQFITKLLSWEIGLNWQLANKTREVEQLTTRFGSLIDLLTRVSDNIGESEDVESGYQITLAGIAQAIGADQAFISSKDGEGKDLLVTHNIMREQVDTCIPDENAPILHRGDGCSLLMTPVSAGSGVQVAAQKNGRAVFIRNPDRPVFSIADGMFVALVEHILSPALAVRHSVSNQKGLYRSTISALAEAIDAKDRYTAGHSRRVARLSVAIGRRIGLSDIELHDLEVAALMHDLGKIGTPEAILSKPASLSTEEFEIIRQHPGMTDRILAPANLPDQIILGAGQHHERLDGSGYPYGLAGGGISLFGRIIAVADVFDALTSDRSYRAALPLDQALGIMHQGVNAHFEQAMVTALIDYLVMELNYPIDWPPPGASKKCKFPDSKDGRLTAFLRHAAD